MNPAVKLRIFARENPADHTKLKLLQEFTSHHIPRIGDTISWTCEPISAYIYAVLWDYHNGTVDILVDPDFASSEFPGTSPA